MIPIYRAQGSREHRRGSQWYGHWRSRERDRGWCGGPRMILRKGLLVQAMVSYKHACTECNHRLSIYIQCMNFYLTLSLSDYSLRPGVIYLMAPVVRCSGRGGTYRLSNGGRLTITKLSHPNRPIILLWAPETDGKCVAHDLHNDEDENH